MVSVASTQYLSAFLKPSNFFGKVDERTTIFIKKYEEAWFAYDFLAKQNLKELCSLFEMEAKRHFCKEI